MKAPLITITVIALFTPALHAQGTIEFDTSLWDIQAEGYIIELYEGYDAIYLKSGTMIPRDVSFLNGTIEYDIYLKNERGFPGLNFRQTDADNTEHFYFRPHLSGKPDANQVMPIAGGIAAWQLYFGPKYSFPYDYAYDRWTHVKIKVLDDKAQIFLDYSDEPQLSWYLINEPNAGDVLFSGGDQSGLHIANVKIDQRAPTISNFEPIERQAIPDLIPQWSISEKFDEDKLQDIQGLSEFISAIQWIGEIEVEEGVAANISRLVTRYDSKPGNTVFAKVVINSQKDQVKRFHFGYSDRVVAMLNGQPIYAGNNNFRSRDYRYLGTIGLFDTIYVNLKKGLNELIFAVSENFGGWLITGKFENQEGVKVQ
ncbi:MAG: hypothetical protein AAGC88_01710 [Bacteroidota bacterium]